MKIDFIVDIHGCADELAKLGYNKSKGYYSHPNERQVIFVGDFIE